MGEAALVDAGYYTKPPKEGQADGKQYNNDWTGTWTKKAEGYGVNNIDVFLNNPDVQDTAIREYHQKVWGYLKDYQQYEGQEVGGIKLCKSGMISAAHLVGHTGLKHFIDSNGQIDDKDNNGVPCSQYLTEFTGYEIDLSFNLQSQQENQNPSEEQPSPTDTYKIQQGDNLSSIAQKNNMTLEQLLAIPGNEQFKADPNAIQLNQEVKLQLPKTSKEDERQQLPVANVQTQQTAPQQPQAQEEVNIHEVKEDDTLSDIAQDNDTTVEQLAADNDISNPDHIEAGQDISLAGASNDYT